MKKINDPFVLEKRRHIYAVKRNLAAFKKTYLESTPEITNHNTPMLWDTLNLEGNAFTKCDDHQANDKLHLISDHIKGKHLNVLNVGFGSGNLERLIVQKDLSIDSWVGVDFSQKSVTHAKKHFPKFMFKKGEVEPLPFKNDTFDYLICLEVLEHISPHRIFKVLKEFNRVVKKNGTVIISVPLNEDLKTMIREKRNINQHVRIYTSEILKSELLLSGFTPYDEVTLISFRTLYSLKKFVVSHFLPNFRKPNGITVYARKS